MKLLQRSATVDRQQPRILIRSADEIGNAVMSMPAVQRLRESESEAHIALTCPADIEPLWRHNPFLNEVIPFQRRGASADLLASRGYDVAVLFSSSFRSAWEMWRAGIPCRIGFAGERRRWLLTDVVKEARSEQFGNKLINVAGKQFRVRSCTAVRHQIRRYLDIISFLGGNRSCVPPRIWLAPNELPSLAGVAPDDGRPLLAINAGSAGPAGCWMPDRFAEVARRVSEEVGCRWLVFGGSDHADTASQIESGLRQEAPDRDFVVNVAGKCSLIELCALLRRCRLLLTGDDGSMHIAAALNVPVVAIFGPTDPDLTGPISEKTALIREPVECSPCFLSNCPIDLRCMERVTVKRVTEAVLKLVAS